MDQPGDERGRPLDFIEAKSDHLYIFMDKREQLSSIIVTPESRQQISESGIIISRGSDVNPDWKIGDRIAISYYTGTHIQLKECYSSSKYHRIIREHEILFFVDQDKREAFNKE